MYNKIPVKEPLNVIKLALHNSYEEETVKE